MSRVISIAALMLTMFGFGFVVGAIRTRDRIELARGVADQPFHPAHGMGATKDTIR